MKSGRKKKRGNAWPGWKFSFSFRSVRGSFVSSMPIRNHWFLGKRVAEVGSHLDVQYPPCPNQIMVNELVVAWVSPSSESIKLGGRIWIGSTRMQLLRMAPLEWARWIGML